jgi:hypothetical protein
MSSNSSSGIMYHSSIKILTYEIQRGRRVLHLIGQLM